MKATPLDVGEIHEVVVAIVRRLNNRGWHSPGCAVHPRLLSPSGMFQHDEPDRFSDPGPCDCGAVALVDRTNRLLDEVGPGQFDLELGG